MPNPRLLHRRRLRRALVALALCAAAPAAGAAPACPIGALSLDAALERAARDNPDLVRARTATGAAQAGVTIAGERPNPTLNAGVTQWDPRAKSRGDGIAEQPLYASVQLQQLIERGGKRDARLRQAHAAADAADADLADLQRRVGAAVRGAYYDLKLAQARAAALRAIADLQQQSLDAAGQRLRTGDISAIDRARLAIEALKADGEAQQSEADAVGARLALGGLLGCEATAPLSADDAWPGLDAQAGPTPGGGERADEAADALRAKAADAALALARAQTHRDVTLGVEWDHDPRQAPNMAGLTLSVPLFLAHRYEGEIAQARAQRDDAEEAAAQTRLAAAAERSATQNALNAAAAQRRRMLDDVLPQAEDAATAVEYAYAHGAAPLLDLLDARRTLRAARLDALSAQHDYAQALAARDAAWARYTADDAPATVVASTPTRLSGSP
ncbi:TolC family protein [Solimonas soli]|uniref:TolC family protein n=1 Tax=Solimonas soli TaxID=413479 RepID=UPI0004BB9F40|nr:TolC family protein [Solimonas soli]